MNMGLYDSDTGENNGRRKGMISLPYSMKSVIV